jgi:signal transduction histidine kinase
VVVADQGEEEKSREPSAAALSVVAELSRARRARNTRALAFIMGGLAAGFVPVLTFLGVAPRVVVVLGSCAAVLVAMGLVARTRHAPLAALGLNLVLLASLFAAVAVNRELGPGPFLAGFPVLVAAATLSRAGVVAVGALSALDVLAMGLVSWGEPQEAESPAVAVAYGLMICGITLGLAWMRAADTRRMLLSVLEHERRALEAESGMWQAQKLGALGRLAGGVAHDFNNLLGVIRSCLAPTLERLPPGSEAREQLRDAEHAIDRAAALTSQLLAFSREQPIAAQPFDPRPVLADLARLLGRTLPGGIELRVELADPLPWISAARAQIEQVVLNLAVNARDAMPAGGTLTLRARGTGRAGADGRLELAVSDTGVGMTEEVRAHLFEPFFTTKPRGEGTGLGLATSYGIVRQLGGDIRVETAPGRGSTFVIELPASEKPAAGAAPVEPRGREGSPR